MGDDDDESKLLSVMMTRLDSINNSLCLNSVEIGKENLDPSFEQKFEEFRTDLDNVKSLLESLTGIYTDLQDRLYDVDKSWQNNLIFHGIKTATFGEDVKELESKLKSLIKNDLKIPREIHFSAQINLMGAEIDGSKPVLACFNKCSDKEEVRRKSGILKDQGIFLEENISRAARSRRKELEKLAKKVKILSPERKCFLRYDQLFIDENVYIYNNYEKRVERLPYTVSGSVGFCTDDEVGESTCTSRRLRFRTATSSLRSSIRASSSIKRAQSVESALERKKVASSFFNPVKVTIVAPKPNQKGDPFVEFDLFREVQQLPDYFHMESNENVDNYNAIIN